MALLALLISLAALLLGTRVLRLVRVWPDALPERVLFGVGWVLAIGAEMLAANSGLGFRLMNARYLLDFPALYGLILIIGVIGYGLDLGLRRLERLTAR